MKMMMHNEPTMVSTVDITLAGSSNASTSDSAAAPIKMIGRACTSIDTVPLVNTIQYGTCRWEQLTVAVAEVFAPWWKCRTSCTGSP